MLVEADKVISFINSKNIFGIEKLNVDVNKESPELEMKIDRVGVGSLGATTGQVGFTMRRAIYGQEISKYKEGKDDYDITMRLQEDQRKSESVLFNQPVTFRNQNNGQIIQVPISSISTTEKKYTFNQIKRKNAKRVMTIYSNVLTGANGDGITKQIESALATANYKMAGDITYSFSGEQEQQKKDSSFLFGALLLALASITIIIVLQFNSISKTMVIMFTVLLSFSGVFYGYVICQMDFVILMTMMGIIALSGIVVKNGIVLMDFFVLLLDEKVAEKKANLLEEFINELDKDYISIKSDIQKREFSHDDLTILEIKEVIIVSGKSRLRPVLLTALTAILGLIPLAIGLNFDFFGLITDLNPHLYMGGDNVIFWAPLAWTIIFGLTYATVLTLVMVPVMFYLVKRVKYWLRDRNQKSKLKKTL
jgi:multidrug efflux pump subunit AcrB